MRSHITPLVSVLLLSAAVSLAASYTITIPNGQSAIVNHLDNPPNDLPTIFGAMLPNKSQVVTLTNCTTFVSHSRVAGSWSSSPILPPGKGFIVNNVGPAVAVTFNGTPVTPVLPSPELCDCGVLSLLGRQTTNAPSSFSDITGLPATEGAKLYRHNTGQPFTPVNNVNYLEHTYSGGLWTPATPLMNMGEAVWVLIPCPANPCLNLQCSTNKVVECSSAWSFDPPTVLTNCCTNVTISVVSTVTNGDCPKVITRTWQATDACTNMTTCSQTVTVVDATPPAVNCSSNKTVGGCLESPGAVPVYTVLKSFTTVGAEGYYPGHELLTEGDDGSLYGTTTLGGASGAGVVFKINKDGTGYTVVKDLAGTGVSFPSAGLLKASDGVLYGNGGGGCGSVFKLNQDGSGVSTVALVCQCAC